MRIYPDKIYEALTSLLLVLMLPSCVTINSQDKKKWEELRTSEQFKKEKAIYQSRIGGKSFCWEVGASTFLSADQIKPNNDCFYPASAMVVSNEGYVSDRMAYGQLKKTLKVLQVTSDGFLVESPYAGHYSGYPIGKIIFVRKTDETGLVDGSYLDESSDLNIYEYSGPYSYATLTGSRTVHSFKKIPKDRFNEASEGLKLYEPMLEFYLKNRLWDNLKNYERRYKGDLPRN